MNTTESNRLFAEFLGAKARNGIDYELYGFLEFIEDGEFEQHFFPLEDMKFHSSWDWLVPLYLKVVDDILPLMDGTNGYHENSIADMGLAILDGDREEALKQAVVAINWYNNQQ